MHTTLFYLGRSADDQCSSISKGSIIPYKTYVRTAFYQSNELTKNVILNGNIYYVLYLADTAFLLGTADHYENMTLKITLKTRVTLKMDRTKDMSKR